MAIQQINLGSAPAGTGGDTQRAANTKINQNFSNQAHAASRLVGEGTGNVLQAGAYGFGTTAWYSAQDQPYNTPLYDTRLCKISSTSTPDLKITNMVYGINLPQAVSGGGASSILFGTNGSQFYSFRRHANGAFEESKFYSTTNTTKDTATGFLKASSPVLHVYNDSITKIHEAEQLDITVDKKGVGHYEIHGTTGLRKNDGWFMSPPRDVHGNVLCMVDLEEKDGVVILRTYKKLFDFETVSIVHDWDNPMDIPEGVCVEFRFNDLPQEQLDEPIE